MPCELQLSASLWPNDDNLTVKAASHKFNAYLQNLEIDELPQSDVLPERDPDPVPVPDELPVPLDIIDLT
jgi:hypothetical protein